MTLGEKIKKYRMIKKMRLKELGVAVGFKESTADVRIAQYEANKMSPKSDIRTSIATALDVDLEALSDINISSPEELIHIFFELEETMNMNINKIDNKYFLEFNQGNTNETLIEYLEFWYNKKSTLPNISQITEEQQREYSIWKSKFLKYYKERRL